MSTTTTPHTQTAYKDTPIGKIPADWEVKKIGEIFNSFPTASYSRADLDEEGEILYLHYGDIHTKFDFHLDVSKATLPSITEEKLKKYEVVKEGDWVLCDASEDYDGVGKSVEIVNLDEKKLIAGLHTFLLREKGNFFAPYFKGYVALNESVRKQFQKLATGTKVYSLSKETLLSVKIPLPPLFEQKRIAEVLSTWDQAIQLTEQLIRQKEQRKKWLMQNLLTGKMRLKGFSGEWKKERLEKYLVKHDEKTTTNKQYPVLTSSRKGIFLQSDYYTRDVASEDNTGYNVVPRGYFTYRHMSDDLIFKFNINDIVDKGIVSTLYPVFTTKGINDYFLLVKLNEGNEFKMHALEQKQGGSRTYVYFNTLCQLKLNMPSIEEQTAIAEVLQAADKEIELLKAKSEKLKEQKKGLMQQLLTGRKRLNLITINK